MKNKLPILFLALASVHARATEVTEDAQKLLGIETGTLARKALPPEVAVFGTVLSPAPVIDLIRQIDTARAALGVSQETLDRAEKLYSSGELVARKDVQAARAQVALDQAALRGFEDRIMLEWGPWFSKKSAGERDKLAEEFLAGGRSIVRLSVPRGEASAVKPLAVILHAFGDDRKSFRSTEIAPALAVDAAFQAQSHIAVIDNKDAPMAVGLSLTGVMELEGKPREGILVPQDAVVFYLGKAWIYQKSGDEDFGRIEIPIDNPVDGGWFLEKDSIKPANIVTRGAQLLLSQETLGPAEEE